jgi:hypothetical protein
MIENWGEWIHKFSYILLWIFELLGIDIITDLNSSGFKSTILVPDNWFYLVFFTCMDPLSLPISVHSKHWIIPFVCSFVRLGNATLSFVISVCLSVRSSTGDSLAPTGRIFMKFHIRLFFENLSRKFKFHSNRMRIMETSHADQYTLLIISYSVLLRMRNFSYKTCKENQNTQYVLFNNFFKHCTVYQTKWKYTVRSGRPQIKIWLMGIGVWILKATSTRSEYVLLFYCNNGCRNALQCYVLHMYVACFVSVKTSNFPFANLEELQHFGVSKPAQFTMLTAGRNVNYVQFKRAHFFFHC